MERGAGDGEIGYGEIAILDCKPVSEFADFDSYQMDSIASQFPVRHPEPCEGPKEKTYVAPSARGAWVYILASRKNGTLYIGVTTDLRVRVLQHKAGAIEGFTKQYGVSTLVHFEAFRGVQDAIGREKELKGWKRRRKIELIESTNADCDDLAAEWVDRRLGPSHGSG